MITQERKRNNMENILSDKELTLECFKRRGTIAQQVTKAMGFEKINISVIDIEKRINESMRLPNQCRGLVLAQIARTIRQERFIHVCSVCKRYIIDGEWLKSFGRKIDETTFAWIERSIPPGQQTHGYCPICYEQVMKEVQTLRSEHNIVEGLENEL
jgi:hypothetical protein